MEEKNFPDDQILHLRSQCKLDEAAARGKREQQNHAAFSV